MPSPMGGHGAKEGQMGESSSDNYKMLPPEKEGDPDIADGTSSRQRFGLPGFDSLDVTCDRQTVIVPAKHRPQPLAAGHVQQMREKAPSLVLNLNLKLRKASLKPPSKVDGGKMRGKLSAACGDPSSLQPMNMEQRHARRKVANREAARKHRIMCNGAMENLQSKMERLATANLELWQSASAARGELEALRGQVELVQGNIRSGVSENSRLQMELNCLRQSLQLEMPELQTEDNAAVGAPLDHIFADVDCSEGRTSQDCMDFANLDDLLFPSP